MPVLISYVETTVSDQTFVSDETIVGYKGELRFMDKQNLFLGSVGRVDAFRGDQLLFVSTTNTDQGLNTTVSADDLRGGKGAPVITRFYHDTNVEITLTDIMFKEAYVEAQLGADFKQSGQAYISEGPYTASENLITLSKTPAEFAYGCGESKFLVWYAPVGTNDWRLGTNVSKSNKTFQIDASVADKKICVRYLAEGLSGAKTAEIYADFVPEELHLIITVPLFAADACGASNGREVGEVQFDIPRFRPNGGQDFAAAMSSNQVMNMSGMALGSRGGCGDSALLYTLTVLYKNETLDAQYEALVILDDANVAGSQPMVYGIDEKKNATLISNALLSFSPSVTAGGLAASTTYSVWATEIVDATSGAVVTATFGDAKLKDTFYVA